MADAPEPTVTLALPLSEAESISEAMADLLCWCRGYIAGCDDADKHPMGARETLELRIKLNGAIRQATGRQAKAPF